MDTAGIAMRSMAVDDESIADIVPVGGWTTNQQKTRSKVMCSRVSCCMVFVPPVMVWTRKAMAVGAPALAGQNDWYSHNWYYGGFRGLHEDDRWPAMAPAGALTDESVWRCCAEDAIF